MSESNWSREDAQVWAVLYQNGASIARVALTVKRPRTTVHRGLALLGVRRRPGGWRAEIASRYWRHGWTSSAIALRRGERMTWAAIGEHYGVSGDVARRHVLRAMRERGINDVARRRGPAGANALRHAPEDSHG